MMLITRFAPREASGVITIEYSEQQIIMAGTWSVEETKALIVVWGQESILSKLDRVHRNRDMYVSKHCNRPLEQWLHQDVGAVLK